MTGGTCDRFKELVAFDKVADLSGERVLSIGFRKSGRNEVRIDITKTTRFIQVLMSLQTFMTSVASVWILAVDVTVLRDPAFVKGAEGH